MVIPFALRSAMTLSTRPTYYHRPIHGRGSQRPTLRLFLAHPSVVLNLENRAHYQIATLS